MLTIIIRHLRITLTTKNYIRKPEILANRTPKPIDDAVVT
jgi:hypothetical protein